MTGIVDVSLSRKHAITFVRFDRKAGQTITLNLGLQLVKYRIN
jgi:hypothetical protein